MNPTRHADGLLKVAVAVDLDFLPPLSPDLPRSDTFTYRNVDRMIRGTFQCWGAFNDLIGHPDIEGCGAGGGTQGLGLAWDAQSEWRGKDELRIHLLFNRRVRGPAAPPLTSGVPVAAEVWSHLPYAGRVEVVAHRAMRRLALRLPDGSDVSKAVVRRQSAGGTRTESPAPMEGAYVIVPNVSEGERIESEFPLLEYETTEDVGGTRYRVTWRGSAVTAIDPPGQFVPLYGKRGALRRAAAPLCAPRYP